MVARVLPVGRSLMDFARDEVQKLVDQGTPGPADPMRVYSGSKWERALGWMGAEPQRVPPRSDAAASSQRGGGGSEVSGYIGLQP